MKTDKVIPFILALAAISLTGCKHQETLIGTIGQPVDLGLSVMWANHNYGASADAEIGKELTWNGKAHSGRQNKTLSRTWGKEWKAPTLDQVGELMDKCTWEWQEDAPRGYIVTGPNGNSIFIPHVSSGYWTKDVDPDHKPFIAFMYFNTSYPDMSYTEADNLRYVRPVSTKRIHN